MEDHSSQECLHPLLESQRQLLSVLQHVHTYTITTKSDAAREHAIVFAEAASRGFISTAIVPGGAKFGTIWKITTAGLRFLTALSFVIAEEEELAFAQKHIPPAPGVF